MDSRFSQDVSTLSNSIKDLKVKAGLSPSSGGGQPNVTSVLDGEKVGDPRLAMKVSTIRFSKIIIPVSGKGPQRHD